MGVCLFVSVDGLMDGIWMDGVGGRERDGGYGVEGLHSMYSTLLRVDGYLYRREMVEIDDENSMYRIYIDDLVVSGEEYVYT